MGNKTKHATESAANVIVGYGINLFLVYFLMHVLGYKIQMHENAGVGLIIACVAFLRGYWIRKFFHKLNKPNP
jgi:hypothetical protein